jgi:hypothetical protein
MTPGHLPPIPSVAAYKAVLPQAIESLSDSQIAMLRAQYLAPQHAMTATQLAEAAKYRSFHGANLQYGKMGQKLRKALKYTNPDGQASYVLSYFIIPESDYNDEWIFVLHPNVVQAIKELDLFNHWEIETSHNS